MEFEQLLRDLEDKLKNKDTEINLFQTRVEDEHNNSLNLSKKLKELNQQLEESIEETETERALRCKAEKQRIELSQELDEMNDKLEEAGGLTNAQLELNKRRECELAKLRHDLADASFVHETTSSQLKKKHQDSVNQLGEQIDLLQKAKNK